MIGKDVLVVFQVLAELPVLDRFQPGLEFLQRQIERNLIRGIRPAMRERQVSSLAGLDRERHADDARIEWIETGGLRIHGHHRRNQQAGEPGIESRLRQDAFVMTFNPGRRHGLCRGWRGGRIGKQIGACKQVGGAGRGRSRTLQVRFCLARPGLESITAEQAMQCGPVIGLRLQAFHALRQLGLQIDIAFDGDQLPRHRQPAQRIAQILAHHALDALGMGNKLIQRAIFGQPLRGGLRPALGYAGYVVDGITDQRQVINDLVRAYAKLFQHASLIEHFARHRVFNAHMLVHQLRHVLVAGRHDGFNAVLRTPGCKRADHVIGFHAVDHQDRNAECAHGSVDRFDLHAQLVRHRRAVRLVFGIEVIAESLALGVEHAGDIIGRRFFPQLFEHVDKAVQRIGRCAIGRGQRLDRMKSAVKVGRAINQQQGGHVRKPLYFRYGKTPARIPR